MGKFLPIWPNQLFLVMKITSMLLLLGCLHLSAKSVSQTMTLKVKDQPLKQIFDAVLRQTSYRVFYNDHFVDPIQKVSITANDMPLEEFLNRILTPQGLSYIIKEKTVLVKKAAVSTVVPMVAAPIQQRTVTGKVTDEKGNAFANVNIRLKGAPAGTLTNNSGSYKLNVPAENAILVFSFLGYTTEERKVGEENVINVSLKTENNNLNEVVVVGYGEMKRQDLTGSVGTVKVEDMQKAPVSSFEQALAGRVAGVQVVSSDGQPGSSSIITIRGNNSVTQDNSPLYVIDGFPVENPDNNIVNPSDIESMDVLKDASATAIYGARGANGVIIINTKRGSGPPSFSFDGNVGYNKVLHKVDVFSPYEFVKYNLQYFPDYATTAYLTDATLDDYKNLKGIDWQDQIEQQGVFQNYNLAVRGKNANGNYSISFNAQDQKGLIINSGFKRYGGRVVLDQNVNKRLKVGLNANYSYTKSYGTVVSSYGGSSPLTSLLGSVWAYRPLAGSPNNDDFDQIMDDLLSEGLDDGVSSSSDYRYNPVKNAANILNDRFGNAIVANGYVQYTLTKGLVLKLSGGINNLFSKRNVFYNSNTANGDRRTVQGANGPNGSILNQQSFNYLNENTLTYDWSVHKNHKFNAMVGLTYQGVKNNSNGYSATNLPNESLGVNGFDEGVIKNPVSINTKNTLASYLGRFNYNYKSTYYLTASFRADGSSKFAPENHWSYFPSGGVSWRITNEPFMRKLLTVINDGKVRATYGLTGNNRVTDYPYLTTITLPTSAGYPFGDNNILPGATFSSLGNPHLKWESTSQLDLGLDLEFLKGRISLSTDYYKKKTSDLLLNASLPGSTGYTAAYANIGKVQNSGFELTVNTVNIKTTHFSWTSSFNISFNRSKVLGLADGQDALTSYVSWASNSYNTAPSYIAKIGQPISMFYGYVFDGVYQYSDFTQTTSGTYVLKDNVPNNTGTRVSIQPGNIKFKDINGDGVVDANDETVIGNPNPDHVGGFSNNLSYKGFDLNIFLQWSYGNDIINANRYVFEGGIVRDRNQFASFANRWSPDNQSSNIPNNGGPNVYSSRVVEDGSFLRLKTVQLGYTFPAKSLGRVGIKTLRMYVSGQNLLTWTNYSGSDPEVSIFNSALSSGFDYSAYPRARTLTAGVNVIF